MGNNIPLPDPTVAEHTQPMPDPTVSIDDRNAYGYTADELLPLSKEQAVELWEQDLTVYLLYKNNTEAMAFDRADIDNHSGLFGIEKSDWTALQELEELWERFNNDHPADFTGHSLSVSDNIAIKKNNDVS